MRNSTLVVSMESGNEAEVANRIPFFTTKSVWRVFVLKRKRNVRTTIAKNTFQHRHVRVVQSGGEVTVMNGVERKTLVRLYVMPVRHAVRYLDNPI